MSSHDWIPLAQVYMKQGLNIGGFVYRQYTTDGQWDLHLHAMGGIVSLRNRAMAQTFYVSTSSMDSCDGFPDGAVSNSGGDAAMAVAGPLPTPHLQPTGSSGGLISNQVRRDIVAPAVVTVNGPEELLPPANLSDEQVAAKNAHFKPVSNESETPNVTAPAQATSPNGYKSLAVPKPAKRKPGRPRKVVMVDPPVSEVSAD